jgi:hypothetical protein
LHNGVLTCSHLAHTHPRNHTIKLTYTHAHTHTHTHAHARAHTFTLYAEPWLKAREPLMARLERHDVGGEALHLCVVETGKLAMPRHKLEVRGKLGVLCMLRGSSKD